MSSILVTGGAGYIGSHFVRKCLSSFPDQQLLVIDNLSEGHIEALPKTQRVVFAKADIGDVDTMRSLMQQHDVEAVVHFAASCYVGESESNPNKYLQNNVINSLKLFDAMGQSGVSKIVYSSSCAVYGNPRILPLKEDHPMAPINVYGMTKHMVELALSSLSRTLEWACVPLRYFNAAGTNAEASLGELHDPETHLIPLALQVANGKKDRLDVYGNDYDTPDGTCVRDYVHVDDLSDAHCRALRLLEGKKNFFQAFNLGSEFGASVQEVVETCRQVSGREIAVHFAPRRQGDPPVLIADSQKARDLLGWKPQHDLRETIASAWEWETRRSAVALQITNS